jgi:hypothetical protein
MMQQMSCPGVTPFIMPEATSRMPESDVEVLRVYLYATLQSMPDAISKDCCAAESSVLGSPFDIGRIYR